MLSRERVGLLPGLKKRTIQRRRKSLPPQKLRLRSLSFFQRPENWPRNTGFVPRKHWDRQGGRVTKGDVLERIASFSKESACP